MRRLSRWAFNGTAVLSLMVFIAVSVMWFESYGTATPDVLKFRRHGEPWSIDSYRGVAAIAVFILGGLVGIACVPFGIMWVRIATGSELSAADAPRALLEGLVVVGAGILLITVSCRGMQKALRRRQ